MIHLDILLMSFFTRMIHLDHTKKIYIAPHNHSLTEVTQTTDVPEVITLNKQTNPLVEDVEGPPDLINTKVTPKQVVQNEQNNGQPTEGHSGNNTKTSVSITEPSLPEMTQSQITHHASISMLTRSMAAKLTASSDSECLFVDFLSKIEPKRVSKELKHPGWVEAMQEELNQFYRNKVWTLVSLLRGKISIGSFK
ncbi:hypothetical protein Tco_1500405 [Tanacetum coccineum]